MKILVKNDLNVMILIQYMFLNVWMCACEIYIFSSFNSDFFPYWSVKKIALPHFIFIFVIFITWCMIPKCTKEIELGTKQKKKTSTNTKYSGELMGRVWKIMIFVVSKLPALFFSLFFCISIHSNYKHLKLFIRTKKNCFFLLEKKNVLSWIWIGERMEKHTRTAIIHG